MQKERVRVRGAAILAAAGVALAGLVLAAVFVRLSLDWSDAQPYEGDVTETRYIVFMLIALVIAAGGLLCGVWIYRRKTRRKA
ncbi:MULTISPECIES: hypothetical protein [unclassified Leucobacter]|uniref:hypothetical protein n=1 Tax=unclassified Leucobacter TaxID=2621730 RepID=UPI00165DE136|nr:MULTISPECIES: hypothetical protein [unclassified Leucobacter]MBC9926760.1 hypothetical protein [Leucobacter sp. cx-169]MBC9935278.1 hypothetical protein [Leucobacter sp. cx-87]